MASATEIVQRAVWKAFDEGNGPSGIAEAVLTALRDAGALVEGDPAKLVTGSFVRVGICDDGTDGPGFMGAVIRFHENARPANWTFYDMWGDVRLNPIPHVEPALSASLLDPRK